RASTCTVRSNAFTKVTNAFIEVVAPRAVAVRDFGGARRRVQLSVVARRLALVGDGRGGRRVRGLGHRRVFESGGAGELRRAVGVDQLVRVSRRPQRLRAGGSEA